MGERLSLLARAKIYGENIEYSGPVYQKMKNVGNLVVLTFGHVGKGLTAKGESLKGFKISGYNKIFVDAKAEIKGDTVEVYNDEIKMPTAVRYGWANYMECNLYNKDGFPARPFRTDTYC